MKSINPYTNQLIHTYEEYSEAEVDGIIRAVGLQWKSWRRTTFTQRAALMERLANTFRSRKEICARLITEEMGKLYRESLIEIDRCANVCLFYAERAERMLADQLVETPYSKSIIAFQPLGVVLEIMPWNFPFWQVMRFTVPAMMAGNTVVLKHASNVCGCALKIEELFLEAGFPEDSFRTLLIGAPAVKNVISHPSVRAVSLTGSDTAGSSVAGLAGREIKKSVMELGGSDPYIVLEDADIELCAEKSIRARTTNAGQTCTAAKRFIVMEDVLETFLARQKAAMESLVTGDPMADTTQIGPLARKDLVEEIHRQVMESVKMGATLVTGGEIPLMEGCFYRPTILSDVKKGMPVFDEETFGPVAVIIPVDSEEEAIRVANDSPYGLGASLWTADVEKGEKLARQIETGSVVVNNIMSSNLQLPFGGTKRSGFGRELSDYGMKEFVNIKTICID